MALYCSVILRFVAFFSVNSFYSSIAVSVYMFGTMCIINPLIIDDFPIELIRSVPYVHVAWQWFTWEMLLDFIDQFECDEGRKSWKIILRVDADERDIESINELVIV